MTRINLVHPSELMDQHLFAEFREIKMVPKALARSLKSRGPTGVKSTIPKSFTLGKGHVTFFYDKGAYLSTRYELIKQELSNRGVNFDKNAVLDSDSVFQNNPIFMGHYEPTEDALAIIRSRIAEKIAMKPAWYRNSSKEMK